MVYEPEAMLYEPEAHRSPKELRAALKRYHEGKKASYNRADQRQAMKHCMAKSFGLPVRDMHPIAESILEEYGEYSFIDAAEAALFMARGSVPERIGDGFNSIVMALATPDLPEVIRETVRGVAFERKSDLLASILALTHRVEVRNYNAQSYSFVDLKGLPAPGEDTMGEYVFANVQVTGEAVVAHSLFARILVTREALTNDDRNYVRAAINAFLASAHRNEMSMIVKLLETNAELKDGSPLFHVDTSNQAVADLDATGLGTAFKTLRSQPSESGENTDAAPSTMLVHADDEVAALALIETLPERSRPRVVATSRLSDADSWYLFADTEIYPTIGRVLMEGHDASAVTFGGFESAVERDPVTGGSIEYNGLALPATHSVGFSVLSRVGAVKLTKT